MLRGRTQWIWFLISSVMSMLLNKNSRKKNCSLHLVRRKMKYYNALLQEHLPEVQHRFPDAIGAKTELEEFSLWRSGRSGAHLAATNNKVPLEVTEAVGRWRKRERAKGAVPNLPMRQVYLRMKLATPTLLAFASDF